MKLPTKLKAGYIDYTIKPISDDERRDCRGEYGNVIYSEALIRINDQINHRQMANTLLHEILHISFEQFDSSKNQEKVVHGLTNILASIIRDNPDVFKWIMEKLK